MACCLLHNLIRKFMSHDPQESVLEEEDEYDNNDEDEENEAENGEVEYVTNISPSEEWLAFRNNMSANMFNTWSNR
ncbi:hypothetical protein Tco_0504896 [Tanacetum coccineum]